MTKTISLAVSDGTTMPAFVAAPDDGVKHPVVIVFQEAFGVNAHIKDVTQRVAALGYVAIAPELFHRTGEHVEIAYNDFAAVAPHREPLTNEALEADARATYEWLQHEPEVNADHIGAVGFCMGGRMSYLANSILPLACAVSFYGAGIAPGLLDRAEKLSGPMLFFWGGLDTHLPLEQRLQLMAALDAAKKIYANVDFSNAGHGFHCDVRESYQPDAARQAWALTVEFFKTYLEK